MLTKPPDAKSNRAQRLAWIFLFAGLIASAFVYWEGKRLVNQELESQLDIRARDARHNLQHQLDEYAQALRVMQAKFTVTSDISRNAFQRDVRKLQLNDGLPAVQAMGFSVRVPPAERATFDAILHKEYGTDQQGSSLVSIHPGVSRDTDAFVVKYIEPLETNRFGVGFDQADEPQRLAAIERARDSGEWAASRRVRLFVTPGNVDGVVFFAPVYRGDPPETVAQRRAAFAGFFFLEGVMN